jgi:cation:H+ antiporter
MEATWIGLGQLLVGGVLLYGGGEVLVRSAAQLGLRLGMSPLVVGLTVVAFGTSSPELAVSVGAALDGKGDVAVGNVIGSNICNIALILGLCACIRPIHVHMQLLRFDVPVAIGVAAAALVLLLDTAVGRIEGGALVVSLVGYVALLLVLVRREPEPVTTEFADEQPDRGRALPWLAAGVGAGLALLVWGGDWFVAGASDLARGLGISEALIALTIVAIGTSTPELATSLIATLRRHGDMAVGNIVGSNIFNVLGILGTAALVRPLAAPGILASDLWTMLGVSLLLLPLAWTGRHIVRWEGALLLALYAGYVAVRAS